MKKLYLLSALALVSAGGMAQSWHEGDITWLETGKFSESVTKWNQNYELNEDDNFFISRVKPKLRFQNTATQVRENLKWEDNDKRLCAWLPIGTNEEGNMNALPSGLYDSECFTMWSYVDHWGNWSCPLGAIPGAFTDVAHKNGVTVSSVLPVPYGNISSQWSKMLDRVHSTDADEAAKFLVYFGSDGIGYNSEFGNYKSTASLQQFHQKLLANINSLYAKVVTGYNMAENLWYDGTATGSIMFDRGLGEHNIGNWGAAGEERASLFFNYNWNNGTVIPRTLENVKTLGNGRNPLWLYCGINMQGGEPTGTSWPMLTEVPLSIGLWGAHSENMFWQYRGENGSSAENKQRRYQHRLENWFTGGSHNPVNCPEPKSITTCKGDDQNFHGMSYFMTARSTMGWDLTEEPFYTFFNIGNGRFLNWKGERANNNEWYNIGVQDYMPTWRWWFTDKFLAKDASAVPTGGLAANFTWEDAYVGGSCLQVKGSTPKEYLHLFKTAYPLKEGDVISVIYKHAAGKGDVNAVMSVEGNEASIAKAIELCRQTDTPEDEIWARKTYTVSSGDGLEGKTVAMIALEVSNADNLDIRMGEFSIKRGSYGTPVTPDKPKVKILRNTHAGVDAKIIFNVPNSKPAGEVCYNSDVNTSMFKIWSQEEGKEPILMGLTTSWAAMCYATPHSGQGKIRYGVSAVSPDTESDSPIAWSDYVEAGERTYSDDISIDKTTITPDEDFTLSAIDPMREFKWSLYKAGDNSSPVAESNSYENSWTCKGLPSQGSYDLNVIRADGESVSYPGYIVVTDPVRGRVPHIETLTANGKEADIEVVTGQNIELAYTGREADGKASRGIRMEEQFFGVRASEVLSKPDQAFSIAGWFKIDEFPGGVNFIDIVDRDDLWPRNNWGWLWSSLNEDGTIQNYDQDYTSGTLKYDFGNGTTKVANKGQWTHFAMVFDRDGSKARTQLYINGKQVESKWKYISNETIMAEGGTNDYVPAYKELNLHNMIIIGGMRHSGRGDGGNAFAGALDEFQIWDKAMTADDVKLSMEGLDTDNLPAGLAAYWDFENDADSDYLFAAKGSKAGAKAGYFRQYSSDGLEGQAEFRYLPPVYCSGTPFIEARNYKVTTVPTWKARLGEITGVEGSDTEGKAKVKFNREGDDYTVSLTLSNDLGTDTRIFRFIKVAADAGVEDIAKDNELTTYTIDDVVYLVAGDAARYDVAIYALDGSTVASASQALEEGDMMKLTINGSKGVYIVTVYRNGIAAKSFKLMKK